MYDHGEPSMGLLVVNHSSEEEDAFPNTSWDEEIVRKLFGDLNRGLLGPPGNGNVIIFNDSDEEENVCEGDHANTEGVPSPAENSLAPMASTVEDGDAPDEVSYDSNGSGDEADTP
jgi:hypothetical protein